MHNWVLIVQQWAAALALREVGPDGIEGLVEVFATGTAGRPVHTWSVVRDAIAPARSTYRERLVAKDLAEIAVALPDLASGSGMLLHTLTAALNVGGDRPYTEAFLTSTTAHRSRPEEES